MESDRRVGFFNRETILRLSLAGCPLRRTGESHLYQVDQYLVEEKGNRRLTDTLIRRSRRRRRSPLLPPTRRILPIHTVRLQRLRIRITTRIRIPRRRPLRRLSIPMLL